jgi:phage-related tail fiber protein
MIDRNSQFLAILTAVGEAKQANADALGIPWLITHMAVGDANGADPIPDRLQTALIHECRRAPLNQLTNDDKNPGLLIAEQVIPADVGGWWVREVGLYDADGDLVAVSNCAPSYKPLLSQGSGRTQVVRMTFIISSTANVVLKIDPSVVLATRAFVDDCIHSVLPPTRKADTYTKVTVDKRGVVIKGESPNTLDGYNIGTASQIEAETTQLQDNSKPMTALRVWQAIAKAIPQATEAVIGRVKIATQAQVNTGTDDKSTVTPKKLRMGFRFLKDRNGYIAFPDWLGGFIIQWGTTGPYLEFIVGEVEVQIAYPISFPGSALMAVIGHAGTAKPLTSGAAISGYERSGLSAWLENSHAGQGVTVRWLAVGY